MLHTATSRVSVTGITVPATRGRTATRATPRVAWARGVPLGRAARRRRPARARPAQTAREMSADPPRPHRYIIEAVRTTLRVYTRIGFATPQSNATSNTPPATLKEISNIRQAKRKAPRPPQATNSRRDRQRYEFVHHSDAFIAQGRSDNALTLATRPAASITAAASLPQHHMAEKTSSIKESSRTSSAPAASVSKRLSTSSPSAPSSGAAAPLLAPLTAAG